MKLVGLYKFINSKDSQRNNNYYRRWNQVLDLFIQELNFGKIL